MSEFVKLINQQPSRLEKFGLFYLNRFNRKSSTHKVFEFSDELLTQKVNSITRKGIILSSLTGIFCVFPTVWVAVHFAASVWYILYGWMALVTVVSVAIEFYLLFIISLKAVHEVSELINMHASEKDFLMDGIFSVQNILSRTALEISDPELKILGIDPFKRVSKKNLLVLGLLYKAKIFITNFILKVALRFAVGPSLFGISILYEALPVESYWNSHVLRRVVHEARLRLFGFALANEIAQNVLHDGFLEQLSPIARIGCLRAIGNAVVLTQNYHPNMIILLLRFQRVLKIDAENKYDDWDLFLETLKTVTTEERNFLLDLFTVAAAFDGNLSALEKQHLRDAYGNEYDLYYPRLIQLTAHLKNGQLNQALALCKLDFTAG